MTRSQVIAMDAKEKQSEWEKRRIEQDAKATCMCGSPMVAGRCTNHKGSAPVISQYEYEKFR